MIHSRVDHRDPIISSSQASCYVTRQNSALRGVIQTLEIYKTHRVRGGRLTESSQPLNHDMRMPNDIPARVNLLRARHVILQRIREPTGFEMVDRDLDGERCVFRESLEVGGEDELG